MKYKRFIKTTYLLSVRPSSVNISSRKSRYVMTLRTLHQAHSYSAGANTMSGTRSVPLPSAGVPDHGQRQRLKVPSETRSLTSLAQPKCYTSTLVCVCIGQFSILRECGSRFSPFFVLGLWDRIVLPYIVKTSKFK